MFVADIGQSIQAASDRFFGWLPNLIGAAVILLIGWLVARVVATAVRRGLRAVGTDDAIDSSMVGSYKRRAAPGLTVSNLVASVAFWFVLGTAILLALSALKIPELSAFIGAVVAYLPSVVAAILILVVGFAIAGTVGALAGRLAGDTMLGKIVQTAVPIVVVSIAVAMALVQLQIAPAIVIATYVIVLGSVGLGMAVAFGLGGREVANRLLTSGFESAQAHMPQMQREAEVVGQRAGEATDRAKEKASERLDERAASQTGSEREPGGGEPSVAPPIQPTPETGMGAGPYPQVPEEPGYGEEEPPERRHRAA